MTRIDSGLLTDTLNLVQLARETAMARGKQAQAQRLSPVVDELKTLVTTRRETAPVAPTGMMAQNDFKALLEAAAQKPAAAQAPASTGVSDRNRMILAMASAQMRDLDIARQFGMTTDEVKLVISASQKGRSIQEVKA
jgi:hypothetical protein